MGNLYIYCEGQTEESFAKSILAPYFTTKGIMVYPIIHRTKEGPTGIFRGGISDYNKAIKEIKRICLQHVNEKVTSFIDYYGLNNIPQISYVGPNKHVLINQVENRLYSDVACGNFIPYVSLHEFESLLFSKPEEFAYLNPRAVAKFNTILSEYNNNPEYINNGLETAPSKRIKKEIREYSKVIDGIKIAKHVPLAEMRIKCKHFNEWITRLETLY